MSDSVKKYFEMKLEGQYKEHPKAKYIWVLDFCTGEVYLYDISPLCNDLNKWNPDSESCEAFLIGAGHQLKNCEWMVADTDKIWRTKNNESEVVSVLDTEQNKQ